MAQGMHADITNILASKRLEKRRRAISEKRRKRKSKKYYIPVKPLISNHLEKGWQNWKFPHIFPHIFSKFSSNFLQLFQMTKMKCFHHRPTNVCKNTVKVKAAFCSNEFLLCQECVIFWLHGFCVNQPCTWCGNVLETSHIWHLVCVC